jgi:hypothetical protein
MQDAATIERIRGKYMMLSAAMDERLRRQWVATEAESIGRGGLSTVPSATGLSRNTFAVGLRELAARRENPAASGESWRIGGRTELTVCLQIQTLANRLSSRGEPDSFWNRSRNLKSSSKNGVLGSLMIAAIEVVRHKPHPGFA